MCLKHSYVCTFPRHKRNTFILFINNVVFFLYIFYVVGQDCANPAIDLYRYGNVGREHYSCCENVVCFVLRTHSIKL